MRALVGLTAAYGNAAIVFGNTVPAAAAASADDDVVVVDGRLPKGIFPITCDGSEKQRHTLQVTVLPPQEEAGASVSGYPAMFLGLGQSHPSLLHIT